LIGTDQVDASAARGATCQTFPSAQKHPSHQTPPKSANDSKMFGRAWQRGVEIQERTFQRFFRNIAENLQKAIDEYSFSSLSPSGNALMAQWCDALRQLSRFGQATKRWNSCFFDAVIRQTASSILLTRVGLVYSDAA
jgi:hypothetical protein